MTETMTENVTGAVPSPKVVSLAGAIIENPELGVLLQLRDDLAPAYPNHWSLFGGHIEPGESPDVAIWRELEEELQLMPEMASAWRLGQNFAHASGGRVYIYYVTTHATLDDLVLGEGESMHFVPISELDVPNPYRGHPFTSFATQTLQTFLETQASG